MTDLTPSEQELAAKLSKQAEKLCKQLGLKMKGCQPKHFEIIVERYSGRIKTMNVELESCIMWVSGKGLRLFTAARFHNWCRSKAKWAKQDKERENEDKKLREGNQYERADYERRKDFSVKI